MIWTPFNELLLFASINDLLRDTDSEEEAEEKDVKNKKMNVKKRSAWLKEGGNEDIVDFLDPSVTKKVLGNYFSQYTLFCEILVSFVIFFSCLLLKILVYCLCTRSHEACRPND